MNWQTYCCSAYSTSQSLGHAEEVFMVAYILAGLGIGLVVFVTLFIISFLALAMITGAAQIVAKGYSNLFVGRSRVYQKQSARSHSSIAKTFAQF